MDRLEVGELIDNRYRVDHPIARGGMSTVYRCVDMRLGRAVAAKIMHDELLDDPVFIRRFEREARAMAQLQHPNLIAVHDFSAEGNPVFLIMELITGGTLRELLAERGPMPPHAATAVIREVLTGLAVVHRRNMVHRDIKPDNILINGDGSIKVGDFGLVRSTTAHTVQADKIVGTVSYLSPEQITGEKITPASDVYSLGVVLFELLTGTVPFKGDTPLAHATARLTEDVPAPSDRIAGVPPLFDALVAAATTRDVEGRFADAQEFLDALDDVARALELPGFTVPVPRHSAAARTAAQPTDMSGTHGTDIFEPTRIEDGPGHTKYDVSDRPRLSFETRADEPFADTEPPQEPATRLDGDAVSTAVPISPAGIDASRSASRGVDQGVGPRENLQTAPAARPMDSISATEEPQEKPFSNRGVFRFIGWLAFSALVTAAIAIGGWWFGSGAYDELPLLIR